MSWHPRWLVLLPQNRQLVMRQKHLCTSQAVQSLLYQQVVVQHILVLLVYQLHHYQRIKLPLHSSEVSLKLFVMIF